MFCSITLFKAGLPASWIACMGWQSFFQTMTLKEEAQGVVMAGAFSNALYHLPIQAITFTDRVQVWNKAV